MSVRAGGGEKLGWALFRTHLRRRAAVTSNLPVRQRSASREWTGPFVALSAGLAAGAFLMVCSRHLDAEPLMRFYLSIVILSLLCACNRSDRKQQVAECVDIYRTAYVTGGVRECLVKRYGWSEEDASEAQQDLESHPDSAAQGDSGQVGDSLRK